MTARGIRNHNPGNIEKDGNTRWQGQAAEQTDPRFVTFSAPEWGIRAMARTLITYQDKRGCDTVETIISRWAPSKPVPDPRTGELKPENHTPAYIDFVTQRVHELDLESMDPARRRVVLTNASRVRIDVYDYDFMARLVVAMIHMECSGYVYPKAVIDKGLELAGIVPPAEPVAQSKRGRAMAGAAAATVVTAALDIAEKAPEHVNTLRGIMDIWPAARWLVVAATIAGIVYALVRHLQQKRTAAALPPATGA